MWAPFPDGIQSTTCILLRHFASTFYEITHSFSNINVPQPTTSIVMSNTMGHCICPNYSEPRPTAPGRSMKIQTTVCICWLPSKCLPLRFTLWKHVKPLSHFCSLLGRNVGFSHFGLLFPIQLVGQFYAEQNTRVTES